ncbi:MULTISPECIES: hypothetical protein [Paenibacillus]|uniref:hypothetical protein n=1 Tax=Paenibacillus TaxID=44249 RepID=UPI0004339C1B|nr:MULTISPECIES: hypothetical protein [Paenibacillus]CDN41071.1 hypothetical protein BN871_AB_00690 [Paenibacillus sp. P22]
MPDLLRLALIAIALLFVGLVMHCVRKGVLRNRYALLWITVSGSILGLFLLPFLPLGHG